ncbi:MAG TPA: F0F1 ATP synthase subunit delta [Rhizomicrobium sp.]|nr:F0F1 ATP synthase subunit delta [Rhizomicrobium sp.]
MAQEQVVDQSLAGRYAKAVFELAQEQNTIEVVERDFLALKAMVVESPDLARLVSAPVFSREDQAKGMKAVLAAMQASDLTIRTILVLAEKRRLFVLGNIIAAFEAKVARHRGEVSAAVTSARPLSDAQTEELKTILRSKLGREARLETKVDPSLLGGLVVKVGSRMIDSSLRTKLDGLRLAMRGH